MCAAFDAAATCWSSWAQLPPRAPSGAGQFGLAIVVGLVFAWVVCRPERRPRLRILALAAALPAGAVCYQILIGLQAPNITQLVRLWQEREYLSQPPLVVAHDLLWRATIALQYVGISILPALPLLVAAAHAYVGRSRLKAKQILLLATLIGSTLCAVLLIGGPLTGQLDDDGQRAWPPLGLWWYLPVGLPDQLFRPLDLAGLAAAAALGAVAVVSARRLWPIQRKSPELILLVATPACLLGLNLLYVQFYDTYIVPFVPFALLLLAVQSREWSPSPRVAVASTSVSLIALVLVSLWIRANFAEQGTLWAAAERLLKSGVPAAEIWDSGYTQGTWQAYNGALDDWLAAGKPGFELSLERVGRDPFHDPYRKWMETRGRNAPYRVQLTPISEPGWRLIARDHYRNLRFPAARGLDV